MTMYNCLGIRDQSFLEIEQMQFFFAIFLNIFELALKM